MKEKVIELPSEFKPLFEDWWREAAVYGGRYSLKSHSIARYLIIKARQQKTRIACFREFQNSIAESSHQLLADIIALYDLTDFEVTNNSITNRINGSDFIFKGLWNNEQSIKSIEGIDIAWVEEAQTVSAQSIEVLTPTVRKPGSKIIYSYNRLLEDDPVHTRLVIEGRPNVLKINVNFDIAKKYGLLPKEIEDEIGDDKAKRPGLFEHKWMGKPNNLEQRIFKDWAIIEKIPHEARLERYGLDFGFTNDPAVIVALYFFNGGYILDEIAYRKGLHNKDIADILLNQSRALIVADSAEPKSIDEIRMYGLNIIGTQKRPGITIAGDQANFKKWLIDLAQSQKISITQRSSNLIKSYQNYMWMTDKDGRVINEPDHTWSDGMDAFMYALQSVAPIIKSREMMAMMPRVPQREPKNPAR